MINNTNDNKDLLASLALALVLVLDLRLVGVVVVGSPSIEAGLHSGLTHCHRSSRGLDMEDALDHQQLLILPIVVVVVRVVTVGCLILIIIIILISIIINMLNNELAKGNKNLVVLYTDADQVVDEACVVATCRYVGL